jgi:nicotinamide phosphoribosyltransferase
MKATYGIIDGKPVEIFKDPITDGGVKKSAKGLLQVLQDCNGKLTLRECVTPSEERAGALQTIYKDGVQYNKTTLAGIRAKIDSHFA